MRRTSLLPFRDPVFVFESVLGKARPGNRHKTPGQEKCLHDSLCQQWGVLHCGAALGCVVVLALQVLVAWSTGDWFGGFALIKVSPTATSPSSHSRTACCYTSGITVHSGL